MNYDVWVLTAWTFCRESRDLLPGAVGVLCADTIPDFLAFHSTAIAEQQRWPCLGTGAGAGDGPAPAAFEMKKGSCGSWWFIDVLTLAGYLHTQYLDNLNKLDTGNAKN